MLTTIEGERCFPGPLLLDALAGLASLFAVIVAAVALGGFSYFAPWLTVTALTMLLAGFFRGRSFGNVRMKAVAMAIPGSLLTAFLASGDTASHSAETKIVGILMFALPAAAGIWLRRRRAENMIE